MDIFQVGCRAATTQSMVNVDRQKEKKKVLVDLAQCGALQGRGADSTVP